MVRSVGQSGTRPYAQARRCRDPRQPARAQRHRRARGDRGTRREAALPAAPRLRGGRLYSPDFNPIENAFAKLKALLRKAAARSLDDLWRTIGTAIDTFTPAECANYFAAAGYDTY